MRKLTSEDLDMYPELFGHGVSLGIKLAFETPVSDRMEHQRGKVCPCGGDWIVCRGFRAGWTSVRKVRAKR